MLFVLALGFLGFASARVCYEKEGYKISGLTELNPSLGYIGNINLDTCADLCTNKFSNAWGFFDKTFMGTNRMCTCYTGGPGGSLVSTWEDGTFGIIGSGCSCGGCFTGYEEKYCTCRERVNVCTCPHGTGATGSACPTHNTAKCISCSGDRYLSNGACLDWTVCSTSQYESTSPTNTQNRVCSTKECTCSGGTGATGSACPTHNTAKCASCDTGYHPNGDACDINTCVCNTGPGATGSECPTHDTYKCEFENIYPPGCSEGTLCTSVKATFFTYDGKVSRDVHPISMIFEQTGSNPIPKAPYFIFGADTTPYTLAEMGDELIGDILESEAECTSALTIFGFSDSLQVISDEELPIGCFVRESTGYYNTP